MTATTTTATAKYIAEHIAKYIAESRRTSTTTALGIESGMPELIIRSTFVFVGQHFVRFIGFLKSRLSRCITRITIRVMFHCFTTIGFF